MLASQFFFQDKSSTFLFCYRFKQFKTYASRTSVCNQASRTSSRSKGQFRLGDLLCVAAMSKWFLPPIPLRIVSSMCCIIKTITPGHRS